MIENNEADVDRLIGHLKKNRERRLSGKINAIPVGLPNMLEFFPGLQKSRYICVSAHQGVSKTKFTKQHFVFNVYEYIRENPRHGIKLKFFYFPLEESTERFWESMMTLYLAKHHNKYYEMDYLESTREGDQFILDEETLDILEKNKDYFVKMRESIETVKHITNPFGIYNHVREYLRHRGKFFLKGNELTYEQLIRDKMFDRYEPDDEEEYVIVIVDHVSLVTPEKNETLHQAMSSWSKYAMKLRDLYGVTVINIHQQSAEGEGTERLKMDKLEPSMSGLGDNKTIGRDYDIVFTIFDPMRHGKTDYARMKVGDYEGGLRAHLIPKNRYGRDNNTSPIFTYMEGASGYHIPVSAKRPYGPDDKVKVVMTKRKLDSKAKTETN